MKCLSGKVWMFMLTIFLATPLLALPDWYTSDGQRFATMKEASDHAFATKDRAKLHDGIGNSNEALPIGDDVTLTVVYGNDERSAALKKAFSHNPLAPARKQMRYESYENGGSGDWARYVSRRELPVVVMQYNGLVVLVRSGREITNYQKLADELSDNYAQCFHDRHGHRHGGGGSSPPPDTDDDTPPPALPPVITTPPPDVGVTVGPNGAAIALSAAGGAFLAGLLGVGLMGWYRRTSGRQ